MKNFKITSKKDLGNNVGGALLGLISGLIIGNQYLIKYGYSLNNYIIFLLIIFISSILGIYLVSLFNYKKRIQK